MGANGRGTRVVHPAREEFHAAREEFRSEFRPARSDVRSTRRAVDDVYRPVHRVHPHLDAFTRIRVRALLRQHQRREQRDFANRVEGRRTLARRRRGYRRVRELEKRGAREERAPGDAVMAQKRRGGRVAAGAKNVATA